MIICPKCQSENIDKLYRAQNDMSIKIMVKCLYCETVWGGVLKEIEKEVGYDSTPSIEEN